jgi:ABC-type transport system involved in cytochrome bd biosynthesis fused ATPase/permease subunit
LGDSGGLAAARILPNDTPLLARAEAATGGDLNYSQQVVAKLLEHPETMCT